MNPTIRVALLVSSMAMSSTASAVNPGSCSSVLFDNGTFVSASTGGGAGTDPVSILTTPDTSFGVNSNSAFNFQLAEDFTVPASGWAISQLTFYAYQTGSTTTSTFTGVPSLSLWNGPPGDGVSTVIAGPVTPTFTTGWTGVYRVTSTTLTNTQRPIMQLTVPWPATFPTPVPGGTYWVAWNESGSLGSLFTAPTTANAADNARQFTGTAWQPITDAGSARLLGIPFTVCGDNDLIFKNGFE